MHRLVALSAFLFVAFAWAGPAEAQNCPNGCSNNGLCFAGACICSQGWSGPDCSIGGPAATCPDGCSGNGACVDGTCECDEGFEGESCDVRRALPGEMTGTWRPMGAQCLERDIATGERDRKRLWRDLELTDLLVTQRDGMIDAFFEGLPFVGHVVPQRRTRSGAAAAQCTTTPASPVAFLHVNWARTHADPRVPARMRRRPNWMNLELTHSDGATYRNCVVWLRRVDDLDPGVPACPHDGSGD